MSTKPQLSKRMTEACIEFLDYTPPDRLNMNLRRLLMNYLVLCKEAHGFDMDDLLLDMCSLMELLDIAADEMKKPK